MSSPSTVKFSVPVATKIDFGHEKAKKMIDILKATDLPDSAPLTTAQPWQLGIDIKFLKDAKKRFEENWRLDTLEQNTLATSRSLRPHSSVFVARKMQDPATSYQRRLC